MKHLLFILLFSVFALHVSAQTWHEQGLIHYYTFDSLPGYDSVQQKVTLSWKPGSTLKAANRHQENDKALDLANAATSLQSNLVDLPQGKDSRTYAVWLYLPFQFQQEYEFAFFQGQLDTGKGFGLGFNFQGLSFASGYLDDVNYPSPFPVGRWAHYALRYHQDTVSLFLDGELKQAERKEKWSTSGTTFTIGALREFGGGPNTGGSIGNAYSGKMDDFRLYNRALSDYEILKLASDDFSDITTSATLVDQPNVLVYPQPAFQTLYIHYDQMPSSIAIYSIKGSFVQEIQPTNAQQVELTGLSSGIYSAVFTWPDGNVLRKKLIVSSNP